MFSRSFHYKLNVCSIQDILPWCHFSFFSWLLSIMTSRQKVYRVVLPLFLSNWMKLRFWTLDFWMVEMRAHHTVLSRGTVFCERKGHIICLILELTLFTLPFLANRISYYTCNLSTYLRQLTSWTKEDSSLFAQFLIKF